MILAEQFIVKKSRDGITIKMPPDLIKDLVILLDALTGMVRDVRRKAELQAAVLEARSAKDKRRREREFNNKSKAVYACYLKHLDNGCAGNRSAAVKEAAKDLRLQAVDVKIYLQQGRKLAKPKKRPRADPREVEIPILEPVQVAEVEEMRKAA